MTVPANSVTGVVLLPGSQAAVTNYMAEGISKGNDTHSQGCYH